MANKKPNMSGLRPFQKGVNPGGGRPKMPPELVAIKKLTKDEYTKLASKYFRMTPDQGRAILQRPESTYLDHYFLGAMEDFLLNKDQRVIEPIISRLVGRPKEEVDLTVTQKLIAIKRYEGGAEYIGPENVVKNFLDVGKEDSDESGD